MAITMCEKLMICVTVLLVLQFTSNEASAQEEVTRLVDPDTVMPEVALVQGNIYTENAGIIYNTDDDDDREARRHPEDWVNSAGVSTITGKSGPDAMSEADHISPTATMGREYVTKGYTSEDSSSDEAGHYYIGNGRRRIGAGFSRRRAPVEVPITDADEQAAQDAVMKDLFADPTKKKAFDSFAHMMRSNYQQDKGALPPMTDAEKAELAMELYGMTHGPQFFEKNNYEGDHLMTTKSVPDLAVKFGNRAITSVKLPRGWCATLFTEKDYQGEKLRLCGPLKEWTLKKHPVTLSYNKHETTNQVGDTTFESDATTKYKTNWNYQASSVMVTKWEFSIVQPTQKCVTSCGMLEHEYNGSVHCGQSHHMEPNKEVDLEECKKVALTQPEIPKHRCAATNTCVKFDTSPATESCNQKCGFEGDTKYGKVWCENRLRDADDAEIPAGAHDFNGRGLVKQLDAGSRSGGGDGSGGGSGRGDGGRARQGAHVKDDKCEFWSLPKPLTPEKVCPATPTCVQWQAQPASTNCVSTCGYAGTINSGDVFCRETKSHSRVEEQSCTFNGYGTSKAGNKPAPLTHRCPPTVSCFHYRTIAPSGTCPTGCGNGASTLHGQIVCDDTRGGMASSLSLCSWQAAPATPTRSCAATGCCLVAYGACVHGGGKNAFGVRYDDPGCGRGSAGNCNGMKNRWGERACSWRNYGNRCA